MLDFDITNPLIMEILKEEEESERMREEFEKAEEERRFLEEIEWDSIRREEM